MFPSFKPRKWAWRSWRRWDISGSGTTVSVQDRFVIYCSGSSCLRFCSSSNSSCVTVISFINGCVSAFSPADANTQLEARTIKNRIIKPEPELSKRLSGSQTEPEIQKQKISRRFWSFGPEYLDGAEMLHWQKSKSYQIFSVWFPMQTS